MIGKGTAHRAGAVLALAALFTGGTAGAQEVATSAPPTEQVRYLSDDGSPFGDIEIEADAASKVEMPKLVFEETPLDAKDFDKYYYFHRTDTNFDAAYRDIVECDGYARGLASGIGYVQAPYPYAGTMAGAVGGAIGSAMAMAIFGSAEKRRLRRVNMRQCMNFKGYQRYGLKKDLWEEFNFEEGLSDMPESRRFGYLKRQALVASSATPSGKELGL